jgi:peptide/nickel transport system permease protein
VLHYALRRLAYLPVILISVSVITFIALRLPWSQDPVTLLSNQQTTVAQQQAIRHELGLDKPIARQFLDWLSAVVRGDLGKTYHGRQPVAQQIKVRLPVTVEILILSVVFSTCFGVLFGIITAVSQNSWIDYAFRVFAVFGQSIPHFFLLILLIVLPSVWWNYSPPVGGQVSFFSHPWENLRLYVPPTLLLAVAGAAFLMRVTRSTLLDIFRQDYMRTARAKGLPGRVVILRHGLRNAIIPIVTITGGLVTELLFGALILEQIFSLNGLGQFLYNSLLTADFPVIQFLVIYAAFIIVTMNLFIDLSYAVFDPTVRYQ